MTRRRKNKPATPEQIAAMRAERAANEAEAARLTAQGDVVIRREQRTRKVTSAQRLDVFALLFSRRALSQEAHDAFRDHEATVELAAGFGTPERRPDHVRASTQGAPGQNVSSAMVEASRLEHLTLERLSPSDSALLSALMTIGNASMGRWHFTVQRVTGETDDKAQASRVRALGENLIHARRRAMKAVHDYRQAVAEKQRANDDAPLPESSGYVTHR